MVRCINHLKCSVWLIANLSLNVYSGIASGYVLNTNTIMNLNHNMLLYVIHMYVSNYNEQVDKQRSK